MRHTDERRKATNSIEYRANGAHGDHAMSTEEQPKQSEAHAPEQLHHTPPPKISLASVLTPVAIVFIVTVILAIVGIMRRQHASTVLAKYTDTVSAPPVSVEQPTQQQSAQEIVLPGNMQAFTLAPIYARTTGYVKSWSHDIGSHVKKGDLLAVIETPELDQQLAQAKADLATAQSNAGLAKTTAARYQDLIGNNAVSQQDTDSAVQQLQARNTEVTSATANVQRLEELVSFEKIVAPFDGVITARNIDIGQLISATGSTTTAGAGTIVGNKQVFDISAIGTLRVFVNVPQIYAPDAKNGVIATLTLPQYPGRKFTGKLVRTSNAVDPATRTLLAEVDVNNASGELLPGSYTEVHLHTSNPAPSLVVPVSAMILEPDGLRLATVDANSVAHLIRVTPGRDMGTTIEILAGLQPGQRVIANPPDSLTDGEKVRVVTPGQAAGAKQ
jgi:RND family efflux transporter MFP subunit